MNTGPLWWDDKHNFWVYPELLNLAFLCCPWECHFLEEGMRCCLWCLHLANVLFMVWEVDGGGKDICAVTRHQPQKKLVAFGETLGNLFWRKCLLCEIYAILPSIKGKWAKCLSTFLSAANELMKRHAKVNSNIPMEPACLLEPKQDTPPPMQACLGARRVNQGLTLVHPERERGGEIFFVLGKK